MNNQERFFVRSKSYPRGERWGIKGEKGNWNEIRICTRWGGGFKGGGGGSGGEKKMSGKDGLEEPGLSGGILEGGLLREGKTCPAMEGEKQTPG